MSADLEVTADMVMCCASCGKAALDDVKLKQCACKLVRYCSVDCQKNHRPQHEKACKNRLAEIREDRLFTQPEISHFGECPICCLPLPIDPMQFRGMSCCSKIICIGCCYAALDKSLERRCPFCREPTPETQEEIVQNELKRAKANDPVGLFQVGTRCDNKGDYHGAIEYYTKAAQLGDIHAHHNISVMYLEGKGVEKNTKKVIYHLEEAAIGGHPKARYNLGCCEEENGRIDRAAKHFIIAAKLGYDNALKAVKKGYAKGFVSKEDYASALRGHQAAVDATKSSQRKEGEEYYERIGRG